MLGKSNLPKVTINRVKKFSKPNLSRLNVLDLTICDEKKLSRGEMEEETINLEIINF